MTADAVYGKDDTAPELNVNVAKWATHPGVPRRIVTEAGRAGRGADRAVGPHRRGLHRGRSTRTWRGSPSRAQCVEDDGEGWQFLDDIAFDHSRK
ncbi:hypothetical protein ACFUIY_12865 [Streptomyces griseorubiginosus]|uniref:hypothetical protein n=1 Tax=Streptomyces griseorubiginosus TaxID=67304 RepID=UPI00363B31BC